MRFETRVALRGCAKAIECIMGFFGCGSGNAVDEANLVEVRGKERSPPSLNCFLVGNLSVLPRKDSEAEIIGTLALNYRKYIPESFLGKEDPHIRLSQSC